jgi:methyl-accepting chemotaxis protein
MNKLSLKSKIVLVGILPLLSYVFFAGIDIKDSYVKYQEAQNLKTKIDVIEAASAVIHESQKERGKSASFLNGGATLAGVKEQREVNNSKIKVLRDKIALSGFSEKVKANLVSVLDSYDGIRNDVSNKSIKTGVAIKRYTKNIKSLLDLELQVAKETSIPSVSALLRSYRILEDSKESGGKLRANMSAILAKNKPISSAKFNTIVTLKSGLSSGI